MYSIPWDVDALLKDMTIPPGCPIKEEFKARIQDVLGILKEKIPTLHKNPKQISIKDIINHKGRVKINNHETVINEDFFHPDNTALERAYKHILPPPMKPIMEEFSFLSVEETSPKITSITERKKRMAPLATFLITGVVSALAGFMANRVDIEIQRTKVNALIDNTDEIIEVTRGNKDAVKGLIHNQQRIIYAATNLTEKLNDLITDYNCQKLGGYYRDTILAEWMSLAPNAFMRILNGVLQGKLTADLIPGNTLEKILQFYPEFSSTIFLETPQILYEVAQVKLVSISSEPPLMEVIVTVPRILYPPFGTTMKLKSCSWIQDGLRVNIEEPELVITAKDKQGFYRSTSCYHGVGMLVCDSRSISKAVDDCFDSFINGVSATRCKISPEDTPQGLDVRQTPKGVLVCPNHTINIITRDIYGIKNTKMMNIKQPSLITNKDGDILMIDELSIQLDTMETEITVQEKTFLHQDFNLSQIELLKKQEGFENIPLGHDYTGLHHITAIGSSMSILTIIVVIIIGCFVFKKYQKHQEKRKKELGHLFNLLKDVKSIEGSSTSTESPVLL